MQEARPGVRGEGKAWGAFHGRIIRGSGFLGEHFALILQQGGGLPAAPNLQRDDLLNTLTIFY